MKKIHIGKKKGNKATAVKRDKKKKAQLRENRI